jgi:NAD+ synthase
VDGLRLADEHIDWLIANFDNIEKTNMDLTDAFNAFKITVPDKYWSKLAFANAKSRLRMVALYQVATATGGMVVGTGNKVEDFGVGFFTKYGDGGVDISPIADFTKTEVREMAAMLGIDEKIIKVAPTDGLWDDTRTDEQQLGASYEELEWAMAYVEKYERWEPLTDSTPRQAEVLKIYYKWHKAGAHKLAPIPTFKR